MPRAKTHRRERLEARLAPLWDHRLGLVVAPAGSGKSTLLAHFAQQATAPVAWYRAEGGDAAERSLLAHLEQAVHAVLPRAPADWVDVTTASAALEQVGESPLAIIVDDLHLIEGTPSERALERLLDGLPQAHVLLVASRRAPRFNLSRLRVSGDLLEIGPDDLRFRSWEVERLFKEFYDEPLPPEDLAELTRRTEGWAAGLQLFHLATRSKPTGERRRMVSAMASSGSRLVREYLTRNVLDELPDDLRQFLVRTCVLGRLTGRLCDDLLQTTGSAALLSVLEQRQIFTVALDDVGTFRYHEVLRMHLEAALVEELGPTQAAEEYGRAAALLEAAGQTVEALRAYCCAEDWEGAARLLGREGELLVDDAAPWLEGLAPAAVETDAWLLLATARRYVTAGRFASAVDAYQRAEAAFGSMSTARTCARERRSVALWADAQPSMPALDHWVALVRAAALRDPLGVARRAAGLPEPTGRLAEGIAACLGGRFTEGMATLVELAERPEISAVLALGALLAAAVAAVVAGAPTPVDAGWLVDEADQLGVAWCGRISRGVLAIEGGAGRATEITALTAASRRTDDLWGAALVSLLGGVAASRRGDDGAGLLAESAELFDRLGAPVLTRWATDLTSGVRRVGGEPQAGLVSLAPSGVARDGVPPTEPAGVTLQLLGRFCLTVGGQEVDLGAVKPRARAALAVLAASRRTAVHREVLLGALWPDVDARAATRNLQVAVSSLRQVLEPGVGRGASSLLVREGDAYRLHLPDDARCDLDDVERSLAAARTATTAGDDAAAEVALLAALDAYAGDLLPEVGPAEWVVEPREQLRLDVAGAARRLAELLVAAQRPVDAAVAAERGLRVDRYSDDLWRHCIDAYDAAGNHAAAARARRSYDEVLAELGVG